MRRRGYSDAWLSPWARVVSACELDPRGATLNPSDSPNGDAYQLADQALKNDLVERSPLLRVVAIGVSFRHEPETVELVALELRAAGTVLHWLVRASRDQNVGQPTFVVTDNLDNNYQAFTSRWVSMEGLSRGESVLVPPPRAAADRLRIAVRRGSESDDSVDVPIR